MLASQGSDGKSDITPLTPFELGAQKANKNYYGYLLLLSFVSFGGHFARSSLSIFGLYFIRDEFISPAGLGMFLSACSLPSMFLPLMVGYLIDKTKQVKAVTMTLLGMTVGGLILFSFAVYIRSFSLAMLALIIFGSGSSSIMAIQRMLITVYLRGNETFTTGFYIALANISKLLGKITIAPSEAAFDSYQLALLLPIFACVLSFASYLLFTWSYDEASDCGVAKKVPCSCKEDNVPCRKATRAMEEVLSSIDIVHYHPSMASMPSVEADVEEAVTLDIGDDLDGHLSGSHMKQGGSDARNGGSTLLNGKSNSPHDAPSPNGFSKQVVLKSSESGGSYKVIKSGPSAPLNFKSKSAKQSESTKPSASSGQGSGAHPNGGSITVPIALKRVYSQVDQPDSRDESEQSSLLSHSALPTRYGGAQTVHALEPPPAGSDHLAHEPRRRRQFTFCCWGRDKNPMRKLPSMFFWYAAVHTMYIMIFHLLVNFIPHYAVLIWKQDVASAGYIASIPSLMIIFLAPLVGGVVDRIGCSTIICTLAALNTMTAYVLLLFIQTSPITIVTLLSVSQALIPALTLAEISRICPIHSVGIAFGVVEVLDSCVNLFGNISFGLLYNLTGSYNMGMCGLMLLSVVGFVILLYLAIQDVVKQRRQRQVERDQGYQYQLAVHGTVKGDSLLPRYSFIARKEQSYTAI